MYSYGMTVRKKATDYWIRCSANGNFSFQAGRKSRTVTFVFSRRYGLWFETPFQTLIYRIKAAVKFPLKYERKFDVSPLQIQTVATNP